MTFRAGAVQIKKGFTDKELDQLSKPKLLGGKTVGEELGELAPQHSSYCAYVHASLPACLPA